MSSSVATNTNSRNPNGSQTIKFFTANTAAIIPTLWKQTQNIITTIKTNISLVIPNTIYSQSIVADNLFITTKSVDASSISQMSAETYNKILDLIAYENTTSNEYFFGTTNSKEIFSNLATDDVLNESSLIPVLVAKIQNLENRITTLENNINT